VALSDNLGRTDTTMTSRAGRASPPSSSGYLAALVALLAFIAGDRDQSADLGAC
jgi:hypothetical protein